MKRMLLIMMILVAANRATVIAQTNKIVYTCTMHPKIEMDKPGSCPVCGMTLVKKTITVRAPKNVTRTDSAKSMNHMPMQVPISKIKARL